MANQYPFSIAVHRLVSDDRLTSKGGLPDRAGPLCYALCSSLSVELERSLLRESFFDLRLRNPLFEDFAYKIRHPSVSGARNGLNPRLQALRNSGCDDFALTLIASAWSELVHTAILSHILHQMQMSRVLRVGDDPLMRSTSIAPGIPSTSNTRGASTTSIGSIRAATCIVTFVSVTGDGPAACNGSDLRARNRRGAPMKLSYIEAARDIAERAHKGQVDKAGFEYITHPFRVAARASARGGSDEVVAAAWLHDVLEDTNVTATQLLEAGIPEVVVDAVEAVTKRSGEPLVSYCDRVRANPIALEVKRADLDDNTDPSRTTALDAATRERLASKYDRVRNLLGLPAAH